MKKALLTAVSLVALGMAPAIAADLPARTYTKAPVAVAPIYNWTGFYVGAMGGYAKENADFAPVGGGFAGGTLGYNFQSGAVVFGIETDAAWSDISATIGTPGVATLSTKFEEIGTVRGRIGYAFDQVLVPGIADEQWDTFGQERRKAGREVVDHGNAFAGFHQRLNHVTSDIAGAAGDKHGHYPSPNYRGMLSGAR